MFTGLVETIGKINSLRPRGEGAMSITELVIETPGDFAVKPGDSVAVNGCCLTVKIVTHGAIAFDVSRESLARTSLDDLVKGSEVNLERAMKLDDRLGGHLVLGHVDGVALVMNVARESDGWQVQVSVSKELSRYVIHKGSVCLDGVSLTVNELADGKDSSTIGITLIPVTVDTTTFKHLKPGQRLNLEVDIIGKYVERLTSPRSKN